MNYIENNRMLKCQAGSYRFKKRKEGVNQKREGGRP